MYSPSILRGTGAVPNPSSVWHLADRHVKLVQGSLIDKRTSDTTSVGVGGCLQASQSRAKSDYRSTWLTLHTAFTRAAISCQKALVLSSDASSWTSYSCPLEEIARMAPALDLQLQVRCTELDPRYGRPLDVSTCGGWCALTLEIGLDPPQAPYGDDNYPEGTLEAWLVVLGA